MPRNTRRRFKKRMVGGAEFKLFAYQFKVGFSLCGYDADGNTNCWQDVEGMVTDNEEALIEIFTKRLSKSLEDDGDEDQHMRNIKFNHIEDDTFELICELNVDEIVDTPESRLRFIDMMLEEIRTNTHDSEIPDLPRIDVGGHYNNEEGGEEYAKEYSTELLKNIDISHIEEFELETEQRGRNLAALKTGLTKGTKTDPALGSGLANMPPNILGRIGSFLTGKNGSLHEQRRALRANAGYNNAGAGAGAGAGGAGGAGTNEPAGRRRRRTRRRRL